MTPDKLTLAIEALKALRPKDVGDIQADCPCCGDNATERARYIDEVLRKLE